jgi:3-oxoacyl-[acyl-carrier protein] reductase
MSMTERRALVTGGSRGIGAAIARALAGSGHRVAVHCRADTTRAEAVAAGLPGHGHAVVTGDIADPGQVRSMAEAAVAALGGIDVLVNARTAPGSSAWDPAAPTGVSRPRPRTAPPRPRCTR